MGPLRAGNADLGLRPSLSTQNKILYTPLVFSPHKKRAGTYFGTSLSLTNIGFPPTILKPPKSVFIWTLSWRPIEFDMCPTSKLAVRHVHSKSLTFNVCTYLFFIGERILQMVSSLNISYPNKRARCKQCPENDREYATALFKLWLCLPWGLKVRMKN